MNMSVKWSSVVRRRYLLVRRKYLSYTEIVYEDIQEALRPHAVLVGFAERCQRRQVRYFTPTKK